MLMSLSFILQYPLGIASLVRMKGSSAPILTCSTRKPVLWPTGVRQCVSKRMN